MKDSKILLTDVRHRDERGFRSGVERGFVFWTMELKDQTRSVIGGLG